MKISDNYKQFKIASNLLWHVEPLLGDDREACIQQPLLGNGSAKDMSATTMQQRNGVFHAVRADISRRSQRRELVGE
jgi:hypothetical protein